MQEYCCLFDIYVIIFVICTNITNIYPPNGCGLLWVKIHAIYKIEISISFLLIKIGCCHVFFSYNFKGCYIIFIKFSLINKVRFYTENFLHKWYLFLNELNRFMIVVGLQEA